MPTQFPSSLDDFLNPTGNSTLASTGVRHSEQHANANDAIEAIQRRIGILGSGDMSSITKQLDDLTAISGTFLNLSQVTQIVVSSVGDGNANFVSSYLQTVNQ